MSGSHLGDGASSWEGRSAAAAVADALEEHHRQRQRSRALRALSGFPEPPGPTTPSRPRGGVFAAVRRFAGWYEQIVRLYGVTVRLALTARAEGEIMAEAEQSGASGPAAPDAPDALDAQVVSLLRRAEAMLLEHPVAARALFRSLVAEGRAFARTAEGARYEAALRRSKALSRQWRILEMLGASLYTEESPSALPTAYIDALSRAAAVRDVRPIMARVFGGARR